MFVPFAITAAVALLQGTPQEPALAPSPIARVVVKPVRRTMSVGDTLRLTAEAFDAAGRSVPAQFLFRLAGGRFEASVDSTGLVQAGATSTIAVSVVALTPNARPVVEPIEIRVVPGPAARIDVRPAAAKLVVGQRVR